MKKDELLNPHHKSNSVNLIYPSLSYFAFHPKVITLVAVIKEKNIVVKFSNNF